MLYDHEESKHYSVDCSLCLRDSPRVDVLIDIRSTRSNRVLDKHGVYSEFLFIYRYEYICECIEMLIYVYKHIILLDAIYGLHTDLPNLHLVR
jgi:hypothetical protein